DGIRLGARIAKRGEREDRRVSAYRARRCSGGGARYRNENDRCAGAQACNREVWHAVIVASTTSLERSSERSTSPVAIPTALSAGRASTAIRSASSSVATTSTAAASSFVTRAYECGIDRRRYAATATWRTSTRVLRSARSSGSTRSAIFRRSGA